MATMCACVASPIGSAPWASISRSSVPWLKRVPRIRKLSAGHSPRVFWPQASRSQPRSDSKPPQASTHDRAVIRSSPTQAAAKRSPSSSIRSTGAS